MADKSIVAEHLLVCVLSVDDAIAEKNDGIAGLGGKAELLVFDVGKHAERDAFGIHGGDFAGAAEERLDRSCVGDLQGLIGVVPNGKEHGHVLGVDAALLQRIVQASSASARVRAAGWPPSA